MTIDRAVALEVQARLPATYRHLLQAMLDLGAPPIFLFHDERRRLVEVRDPRSPVSMSGLSKIRLACGSYTTVSRGVAAARSVRDAARSGTME